MDAGAIRACASTTRGAGVGLWGMGTTISGRGVATVLGRRGQTGEEGEAPGRGHEFERGRGGVDCGIPAGSGAPPLSTASATTTGSHLLLEVGRRRHLLHIELAQRGHLPRCRSTGAGLLAAPKAMDRAQGRAA